eukprot:scaffold63115_cov18-Prasinocladus_malaysianus.AAC.1
MSKDGFPVRHPVVLVGALDSAHYGASFIADETQNCVLIQRHRPILMIRLLKISDFTSRGTRLAIFVCACRAVLHISPNALRHQPA